MSLSTVYTATGRLEEIRQKLQEAIQKNDAEQTSAAFEDLFQHYADVNRQEYELLREETDVKVLASRGVRQLTTREREYYQKLGEAMNAKDPRQAVNNLDVVMYLLQTTGLRRYHRTGRRPLLCPPAGRQNMWVS